MKFWKQIEATLKQNLDVILLCVIDSQGSSPGRRGFKMAVDEEGQLYGSIGGGIMEHKLVDWCKKVLVKKPFEPFIKRQIHRDNIARDKSGMICSGEQTVAFYYLDAQAQDWLKLLNQGASGLLIADENGWRFEPDALIPDQYAVQIQGPEKWLYKENPHYFSELHIVGGGHVGLALSKFGAMAGYKVFVYDDRKELNTLEQNQHAECIWVPDYASITDYLQEGANKYVVLMSFGYRTDKIILKELLHRNFKYLGMMGSKAKVQQLKAELLAEGFKEAELNDLHAPIGLQIASKTPEEIAISILAEIIQIKNQP